MELARRWCGDVAALTIAASHTGYSDVAAATALGLALAVLARGADRTRLRLLGLLGALAGFQLMVKTNDGLLTIGILVVVVGLGEIHWKWATVVAGVPLVAVFLLGWLAAGQSVTNIASYVRVLCRWRSATARPCRSPRGGAPKTGMPSW